MVSTFASRSESSLVGFLFGSLAFFFGSFFLGNAKKKEQAV